MLQRKIKWYKAMRMLRRSCYLVRVVRVVLFDAVQFEQSHVVENSSTQPCLVVVGRIIMSTS